MHLKIRAILNIRERCQIQKSGRIFPLGAFLVTVSVQLGRGNPISPLLPYSHDSFLIWISATEKML